MYGVWGRNSKVVEEGGGKCFQRTRGGRIQRIQGILEISLKLGDFSINWTQHELAFLRSLCHMGNKEKADKKTSSYLLHRKMFDLTRMLRDCLNCPSTASLRTFEGSFKYFSSAVCAKIFK